MFDFLKRWNKRQDRIEELEFRIGELLHEGEEARLLLQEWELHGTREFKRATGADHFIGTKDSLIEKTRKFLYVQSRS